MVIARGATECKVCVPNHCVLLLFNRRYLKVQGKRMHSGKVETLALIFIDRALASSLSNPITPTSKQESKNNSVKN